VRNRRLEEVGLGHLAIDLHGADLSPNKVMLQVAHTLEVLRSSVPVNEVSMPAKEPDHEGVAPDWEFKLIFVPFNRLLPAARDVSDGNVKEEEEKQENSGTLNRCTQKGYDRT
jgi:hypothetical protein